MPEQRPVPISLAHHPDFLKLWSAETVSQLGSQVSQLAIPFVALGVLNASTFEIALLNVVEMLPFLLIGLVAGVWVDRLRRRPILIAGDLGRAALLATIPIAYLLNVLTMIQLYVVGASVGALTAPRSAPSDPIEKARPIPSAVMPINLTANTSSTANVIELNRLELPVQAAMLRR